MPDPPAESLFTRLVLENNYPLAIGLIVVGVVIGWLALRDGRLHRLRLAAIPVGLGVATFLVGLFVQTAGEHASAAVRGLVDAVVAGDRVATMNHFSDDARLRFGSTLNAARDRDGIGVILDRFDRVVSIDDNRITRLRAYTTSADSATVHLGNWTSTSLYEARSECVVEVVRTPDGLWKIDEVTVVTINGQKPPRNW